MSQIFRRHCGQAFDLIGHIFQRMAGQIDAQHFLFHGHEHGVFKFCSHRKLVSQILTFHGSTSEIKETHLSFDILTRTGLGRFQQAFVNCQLLCSISFETICCPGFDQAFHRIFLHFVNVQLIDEAENVGRFSLGFAGTNDFVNDTFAHVLYCQKSKADLTVLGGAKLLSTFIYIRRKDFDAHFRTVSDVFCHRCRIAHDAGHQRSHKFHRIIVL